MLNNIYDDEVPNVVEVKDAIIETPTVKTITFNWDITDDIHPGQFVMVWNFENEKPMTMSIIDKLENTMAITIRNVGPFTENLYNDIESGDLIGIRGPYGHGYEVSGYNKVLAVGGGTGVGSLAPLLDYYDNIELISAAATKEELLFVDKFKDMENIYECTDDGSKGFHGFSTQLAEQLLLENDYDLILACGPEIMSYKIYELSKKYDIDCQLSLERYMKCGLGICGQCCLDDLGLRTCREGPVFNKDQISNITEFGKYKRDASGTIIEY